MSPEILDARPTHVQHEIINHVLAGSTFATARMPWGERKPGPIRVPTDRDEYERLIGSHLLGHGATVDYCPADREPSRVRVDPATLSAFCPAADGLCRWIACDLDAADGHGPGGLLDPIRAARAIVQAAREHGLDVLTARSGSGSGVHVWALLGEPCELPAAVLGVARLAAAGLKRDRAGFATGDGRPVRLGDAGCVELIPKSTQRPRLGWPLTLPFSGAARARGGGHAIDPMTGEPCELDGVPVCDAAAWRAFVAGARARLPRPKPRPAPRARHPGDRDPLDGLDSRTADFLAGRVEQGGRNRAAFAAACSLLGRGVAEQDAERLIFDGAAACGLPAREARTAFASACGAMRAKAGRR